MAKRIIEVLTSDLSGDEMKPGEGRTVEFSVDGSSYTIDLTDKEAAGFDKAVGMYVEHAVKVGGRARRASSSSSSNGSGRSKDELQNIRAWLRENGHEVSERGRIRAELVDLYHQSH